MTVQPKPIPETPTGAKPQSQGFKKWLNHRTLRRIIQIGAAGFITFLAVQLAVVGEGGPQAPASPEAFCPFGGLETLYKFLTSGGSFVSHTHLSNVVMLIAVLASALLLRSAFCGWICPLGFLQELMSMFSRLLQKRISAVRRGCSFSQKTRRAPGGAGPLSPLCQIPGAGLDGGRFGIFWLHGLPRF